MVRTLVLALCALFVSVSAQSYLTYAGDGCRNFLGKAPLSFETCVNVDGALSAKADGSSYTLLAYDTEDCSGQPWGQATTSGCITTKGEPQLRGLKITQQGGVQPAALNFPNSAGRTTGSAAAGLLVGGAAILALA